jgi:hypothetical protein
MNAIITTTTEKIIKHLTNACEIRGGEHLVSDFEFMYLGFVSSQTYDEMSLEGRECITIVFLELQKALQNVAKLKEEKSNNNN